MSLLTQSRYGANCWQPPPRPAPLNQLEIELDWQDFWRLCFRAKTITAKLPISYQVTHRFSYWNPDGNGGYEPNPEWTGNGDNTLDPAGLNLIATLVQSSSTTIIYRSESHDFTSPIDAGIRLRDTLLGSIRFPAISFPINGTYVFSGNWGGFQPPNESGPFPGVSFSPSPTPYKDASVFYGLAFIGGALVPETFGWLDGDTEYVPLVLTEPATRPRHNQADALITQEGIINFFGTQVPCFYPKSFTQDALRSQYVFNVSVGPLEFSFGPGLDP